MKTKLSLLGLALIIGFILSSCGADLTPTNTANVLIGFWRSESTFLHEINDYEDEYYHILAFEQNRLLQIIIPVDNIGSFKQHIALSTNWMEYTYRPNSFTLRYIDEFDYNIFQMVDHPFALNSRKLTITFPEISNVYNYFGNTIVSYFSLE